MYWSINLPSQRRDKVCLETRSVLVEEARVAWEPLWLRAEEFAVLVDSEDINVLIKLVSETAALLLLPVNPVLPDFAAGDSLAGGTLLLRVPGIRGAGGRSTHSVHAEVVRALIHDHCLSKDAIGATERRPLSVLEIPPHITTCIAGERIEIADMVVVRWIGTVVPAVRLTWRLQVPASAAAVLLVPFPLIDGVTVYTVGVGHLRHVSPQEDGRGRSTAEVELNQVGLAVRISGRVDSVGRHPAVAAHHSALVWDPHAPTIPFPEEIVVL